MGNIMHKDQNSLKVKQINWKKWTSEDYDLY